MSNGWVKIHRKIIEWEWYRNANVKELFLHLLFVANHADKKWQGTVVKRGELVTSYQHLSEQTSLSVRQVRTALNSLILTGEVTKQSNSLFTRVSIKNYNEYQELDNPTDKRMTSERQTNDKPMTTNKNDKNDKNLGSELSEPARKGISFKKEDYTRVLREYQNLKGIKLQGKEFDPVLQAIKTMFVSKRSVEDIIYGMNWLEKSKEEWTNNWTINTVKIKLPVILAERGRAVAKKSARNLSNLEKMGVI